mgnify:CR=1 FL=1
MRVVAIVNAYTGALCLQELVDQGEEVVGVVTGPGAPQPYALAPGAGGDDDAWVTIDASQLKTAESFDYERKPNSRIRVTPCSPTKAGTPMASPSTPYSPSHRTETGRSAFESDTMASTSAAAAALGA